MSAINPEDFFKKKRSTSEIKSEILNQYFKAWSEHWLLSQERANEDLIFIDLFAGQGFSNDSSPYAFAQILYNIHESIGAATDLNNSVKVFYNDANKAVAEKLKNNLEALELYNQLANPPVLLPNEGYQEVLESLFNNKQPRLIYLNPFVYENALRIVEPAVTECNSDLLMLFNFNQLRAAVIQAEEDGLLQQLFGFRLNEIRKYYQLESSTRKKEKLTLDTLEVAFKDKGAYTFKFKINLPDKEQTSHYIVFISRSLWGYFKIKEILKKYSDYQEDQVPLFEANQKHKQPLLPGFFNYLNQYNIASLTEELAKGKSRFHYKTIQEIYEDHSPGTNFIIDNYITAFEKLRQTGKVNIIDDKNKQVKAITYKSLVFYKLHGSLK